MSRIGLNRKIFYYIIALLPLIVSYLWIMSLFQFEEFLIPVIMISLIVIPIILFLKYVIPIITEQADEDFLEFSHTVFRIVQYAMLFVIVALILFPFLFFPFFLVFTLFSGYSSIVEIRIGIREKKYYKVVIALIAIIAVFVSYFSPTRTGSFFYINIILFIPSLIVWTMFLFDQNMIQKMKLIREQYDKKGYVQSKKYRGEIGVFIVFLFIFPIYAEFWQELMVISEFFFDSVRESYSYDQNYAETLTLLKADVMISYYSLFNFSFYIVGMIFAIIAIKYLKIESEGVKMSELQEEDKLSSKEYLNLKTNEITTLINNNQHHEALKTCDSLLNDIKTKRLVVSEEIMQYLGEIRSDLVKKIDKKGRKNSDFSIYKK